MIVVPAISATYPTVKGCHIPKDEPALNIILDDGNRIGGTLRETHSMNRVFALVSRRIVPFLFEKRLMMCGPIHCRH